MRRIYIMLLALAGGLLPLRADDEVVFHSDVSLVRVDTQVLDRDNRAITGLNVEDFILLENGKPQEIRNFANENMPVDVLLLLDVSGSMRPHVERIASAAHQALRVLGERDRVAIMVFDRSTRLRLPFRGSRDDVERGLESLLRQESFNGGTDITQAMLEAAHYVWREARHDARRAIVILTDDETEFERNEPKVSQALVKADAVMSALIAPDAMRYGGMPGGVGRRRGGSGGSWPGSGGGSTWPGSGGPLGGPLGGIILGGPRGGYGGPRGGPGGPGSGPVMTGPRTHSAGTSEIARQSGGDSMPVDDASALETTLERIRQRYALHYHLPEGLKSGQDRNIEVQLSDAARRRYPGAEIRFRRINQGQSGTQTAEPTVVTRVPSSQPAPAVARDTTSETPATRSRRRTAISEPDGPRGANASAGVDEASAQSPAGPTSAAPANTAPTNAAPANTAPAPPTRGWRRVDEPAPPDPAPASNPKPARK